MVYFLFIETLLDFVTGGSSVFRSGLNNPMLYNGPGLIGNNKSHPSGDENWSEKNDNKMFAQCKQEVQENVFIDSNSFLLQFQ